MIRWMFISDAIQRPVELGNDVVDVLKPDGKPDQLWQDPAFPEVLVGELRVRRRCRMYDKRLRVSDVGENREDLAVERVRETSGLLRATLDAEDDHSACAVRKILLREFRLCEGRVLDPRDLRVLLEVLCYRERVFAVARDTKRQRLDALEEDPRGVRRERRALVADTDREKADRKRDWLEWLGEIVSEPEAVVAGVRLVVERELWVAPVEAALLDNYAAYSGTVSANPFR